MINDPDANHSRRSPRLALAAAVLLLFAARLEGANPPTQADLPPQPKFFFAGKSFDASRVRIIAVEEKDAAANSEKMAPILFSEELEKRTKIKLTRWTEWPADETLPVIAIASRANAEKWKIKPDEKHWAGLGALKPEGFLLYLDETTRKGPTLWVLGVDGRGTLFGAGKLLRLLSMTGSGANDTKIASLPGPVDLLTAPVDAIRGHQLGYRNRANSWDAWTIEQYEQYIRDLVVFGMNSVENIPFSDDSTAPHMKYPRREFNKLFAGLCAKYDLDHWIWTPVEFDLTDAPKRAAELDRHEQLYQEAARLDGVFFPGGDPGHNRAALVIPFLEDLAPRLAKYHPKAKIWLSLQWFGPEDQQYVYDYIAKNQPAWLGGLVAGPSSPPLPEQRARLDRHYRLRDYPDITHSVRCQYPVWQWDRAFNLTLGRECINPRPVAEKHIHNLYSGYTDGFISYSDGVHDDVNKIVWNLAGWEPNFDLREGLVEYATYLMGAYGFVASHPEISEAEIAADGILGLEKNWEGAITSNGSIESTYTEWLLNLEFVNWRSEMCRFRACYDHYERQRQLLETPLQMEVDTILRHVEEGKTSESMRQAYEKFARADKYFDLYQPYFESISGVADALYKSIGLQTSVEKYHASESERGCVMDFVRYPLNDRWYYEDRFKEIAAMTDEKARAAALRELGNWMHPPAGSFYDDIGNIGAQPHAVIEGDWHFDPEMNEVPNTEFTWANGGNDRRRLAWQDWEAVTAMKYEALDPKANYKAVATMHAGPFKPKLFVDEIEAEPMEDPPTPPGPQTSGKFGGAIAMKAWKIPAQALADGRITLRWEVLIRPDKTIRPELAEAWLLKEN